MSKKLAARFVFCLVLVCAPGFAASVNVPFLELMTRGALEDGLFGFTSRGALDLKIEGGVKFGGRLTLSFDSEDLELEDPTEGIRFKSAEVELRDVASLPLSIGFFVGENDTFASGDAFPTLFGTADISTRYRGFFYFPDSTIYDGLYTVKGTGLNVRFPTGAEHFYASLYLYQDMRFRDGTGFLPGHYSLDIRALLNFPHVKIESFLGATIPAPTANYGAYRAGLLFYAGEQNVEFFAQLGIPRFEPTVDAISLNLFYLLFEPRVNLGLLHIIPTFFWHPQYYLNKETNELGSFDVNLNFLLKRAEDAPVSGGAEASLVFAADEATGNQELSVTVSPYLSLITPGVLWDLKVNANLFPFVLTDLVEVFLGIQATF